MTTDAISPVPALMLALLLPVGPLPEHLTGSLPTLRSSAEATNGMVTISDAGWLSYSPQGAPPDWSAFDAASAAVLALLDGSTASPQGLAALTAMGVVRDGKLTDLAARSAALIRPMNETSLSNTSPEEPDETTVPELTDRARERLRRAVLMGAKGGAYASPEWFREAQSLVRHDGKQSMFAPPVDSEIPEALMPAVITASAEIITTLTERANPLSDLRRELGAEAVDWATARLDGILIHHVDKGWCLLGGAPRKTPDEVAKARAERAAKKAEVVETPATAAPAEVETTPALSEIAANTKLTVDGLSAMYSMFQGALPADDLHEGVNLLPGRKPTVKAVAQRIAEILYVSGEALSKTEIKRALSTNRREKRDHALNMGLKAKAFRATGFRFELIDPEPLGLSWEDLERRAEIA